MGLNNRHMEAYVSHLSKDFVSVMFKPPRDRYAGIPLDVLDACDHWRDLPFDMEGDEKLCRELEKRVSCGKIPEGKCAAPVIIGGAQWIATSSFGNYYLGLAQVELHRVYPRGEWTGQTWSYKQKSMDPRAKKFSYEGIVVRHKKEEFVIGEETLVVRPRDPWELGQQLKLGL